MKRALCAVVLASAAVCACGGGSGGSPQSVAPTNPIPAMSALSPSSAASGSPALTLTVSGSDFTAASSVNWNGVALATNYVDASHLTAMVTASDLTTIGTASVTVFNPSPGGGTSAALSFTISASNPVPSISALSPSSAASDSPALALAVNGSDFVAASTVNWNGAALTTSFIDASHLQAVVPASDLTTVGTASVTVFNPGPGGGASAPLSFTISASNPAPSISSLSPSSAASGSPALLLSVNGSDFVATSSVNWNGVALMTSYVDASHLSATIPASDLTAVGTGNLTVFNPSPGGGTSAALAFTINASNPLPSITSLSPSSCAAGSPALTLTVTGSNFVASSSVKWNGAALATSYVDAAHLNATVPASDLTSMGTASVAVSNPSPGGGTSGTSTFTINPSNPVPSISALTPSSTSSGSGALTLTVDGSNFVAASSVHWNGASLSTSYLDASHLTAIVPASDLTGVGTANVTVVNPSPGGGTSGALTFTINAASSPSVRQSAQYTGYPGANSNEWQVTLTNVQAGSTIYVVGTWPNFASNYPTMGVTDTGSNTYVLLDRYDDTTRFNLGIQGTQSVGHWYTANVKSGNYTINMAPSPATIEDWVAVAAFEVAGVGANPLDGHALNFQRSVPPGTDTVTASVTSAASSGILVAVTFDDIDSTVPTVPLAGSGFADLGSLWDFTKTGKFSARAEDSSVSSAGVHTATFSAQEGGTQRPNYITPAAVFH